MKRILPILFILPVGLYGYACKSSSSDDPSQPGQNGGGDNGGNGGGGNGGSGGNGGGGGGDVTRNPIEGIAPAKVLLETDAFTDGPVWHAGEKVLFFTTPLGEGGLYRVREDGSAMKVRDGDAKIGAIPIGNAVDKAGNLFTVEAKRVMRGGENNDAGAPTPIATGYRGEEGGVAEFDTLNDAVVSESGNIYVTDPGYFGTPMANRIYRIDPQGQVTVAEAFDDVPRPNGVALSPDQKTLYVGFSQPIQGTKPFVRKYIVNADGSLGEHAKFVDVDPMDSAPDGIEVDKGGNVYVATKAGIQVFKADGSKIGTIAVPEQPTGMAFGGADLKTLFITTQGTKLFTVTVNVPGIAQ